MENFLSCPEFFFVLAILVSEIFYRLSFDMFRFLEILILLMSGDFNFDVREKHDTFSFEMIFDELANIFFFFYIVHQEPSKTRSAKLD